jgi:6,7-dimethyl-8-ribityllumazine synthase
MREIQGRMDAAGKRFAIVVSRWNELVTKELLEGALDELARHGAPEVEVVRVPGTWEIPPVVSALFARSEGMRPHAVVALGCILQGQTPHAKLLGGDVGGALMALQVEHGIPVSWGILTPDTQEQALDRAGLKVGNKGREAALAAVEMASLMDALRIEGSGLRVEEGSQPSTLSP